MTQHPTPYRIVVEGIDGVGKTTLISALRDALATRRSVLTGTMAPITLDLFKAYGRDMAGDPQKYWTEVSRRTKTQVFLTEGVARAEYLAQEHAAYDVLVHDRWWQTFHAYTEDPADFDHRCRFLKDALPHVDLVLYLRGDVAACAARLVAMDDWLVLQTGEDRVADFLQVLQDRYDEVFAGDPAVITIDVADLSQDAVAALVVEEVTSRLPARRPSSRPPGAYPATRTTFGHPSPEALCAVEGVDGAGKSTLVHAVAASARTTVARLASASLRLFKSSVPEAPDGSSGIRAAFEDEFRHQTYLVDGLVGLSCLAEDTGPWLFDRWFPLFAIYQDAITTDRPFFDYLLSRFPTPAHLYYLDLEPADALARLRDRGDWMPATLGDEGTLDVLAGMRERHRPRLLAAGPRVTVLDARRSPDDLAEVVGAEVRG